VPTAAAAPMPRKARRCKPFPFESTIASSPPKQRQRCRRPKLSNTG